MSESEYRYLPASPFLRMIIQEDVPLSGSVFSRPNIEQLIELMRNADRSNRDWATLLLAQTGVDTPEVRSAFSEALGDDDEAVRMEALIGLAKRDPDAAMPHVEAALAQDTIQLLAIEAASYVASAGLLPILEDIKSGWVGEKDAFSTALDEALASCTSGEQPGWRFD
jgi:hypothetical protein